MVECRIGRGELADESGHLAKRKWGLTVEPGLSIMNNFWVFAKSRCVKKLGRDASGLPVYRVWRFGSESTDWRQRVKQRIRNFIEENFFLHNPDGADDLSDSDSLMASGVIDSTGVLELTAWLEKTFNITVADEDLRPANLDSIDNIVNFVTSRMAANG